MSHVKTIWSSNIYLNRRRKNNDKFYEFIKVDYFYQIII